jgi:hypothetical protein
MRSGLPILLVLLPLLFVGGCGEPDARSLDELTVVDSVYVDPESGEPFTGGVVRHFARPDSAVQLRGTLLRGVWHGELIVYHPNGRVRYMGTFAAGERCGPWVENADSLPTENAYEELVREVESMGLYPPCDGPS